MYASKGILRYYHYRSDTKLVLGIGAIIIIPNCFAMLAQLYYLFPGILQPNKQLTSLYTEGFIIINTLKFLVVAIIGYERFQYDGTDEEYYENINQTILDGNAMNISLIIMEEEYDAVDNDDSSCHGYYIINFSLSPYTLQAELIIHEQGI